MMTFLAFVLFVTSAALALMLFRQKKKNASLSSYVSAVEAERNTYRRDLMDLNLQNQVLVAKLEQIDKVLKRLGADSVRARIQPFLLSAGAKNDAR